MTKKIYQVTVFDSGREEWRLDGNLHRDNDKPAIIDGCLQIWCQHGKQHRDNDLPAYIEGEIQVWYQHGERHRVNDKPAVSNGHDYQAWYQHKKRHRLTGPAIIWKNKMRYFIDDNEYSKEDFDEKIKQMNQPTCEGKIVEIDGKKYQLTPVD